MEWDMEAYRKNNARLIEEQYQEDHEDCIKEIAEKDKLLQEAVELIKNDATCWCDIIDPDETCNKCEFLKKLKEE